MMDAGREPRRLESCCSRSRETLLREPTYLHSFSFGDSLLGDLWFVPDRGKSEFVLHLEDEAAEHNLLIYLATNYKLVTNTNGLI